MILFLGDFLKNLLLDGKYSEHKKIDRHFVNFLLVVLWCKYSNILKLLTRFHIYQSEKLNLIFYTTHTTAACFSSFVTEVCIKWGPRQRCCVLKLVCSLRWYSPIIISKSIHILYIVNTDLLSNMCSEIVYTPRDFRCKNPNIRECSHGQKDKEQTVQSAVHARNINSLFQVHYIYLKKKTTQPFSSWLKQNKDTRPLVVIFKHLLTRNDSFPTIRIEHFLLVVLFFRKHAVRVKYFFFRPAMHRFLLTLNVVWWATFFVDLRSTELSMNITCR